MQTKLTLRLDDQLINRAKAFASQTGKSVSQLVAVYFARQWVRYESNVKQWATRVLPLTEMDSLWRARVGRIELPDLRGTFLTGYTLQGGHPVGPNRATIAAPAPAPAISSPLIRPVFDDLSLVLR